MSSSASHLPSYRILPRFQVESPLTAEEVIGRLKKGLEEEGAKVVGVAKHGYAALKIPPEIRHYWSPQLSLSIENLEDKKGCLIRGLYGPAPNVWTLFIFFYALVGLAFLGVLLVGVSYLTVGMDASILWWALVLAGVLASIYLVSYFGQRLGHDQMEILHNFLEEKLGHAVYEESRI
ncbi:MAG: hypothetical protein Kow0027_20670 [Saprospiraceae bacterium]